MPSASPSSASRLKISSSIGNSAGCTSNVSIGSRKSVVKNTPNKRPLLPAVVATPNHGIPNHNHRNNSIRLRSPKGSSPCSKRNHVLTWLQQLCRVLPRWEPLLSSFVVYSVLLIIIFSVAYTTLLEFLLGPSSTNTLKDTHQFTTSLITSTMVHSNSSVNTTLSSFDATLHHVIPKSIYMPKSSHPIPVIYIGRSWWQAQHPIRFDQATDQDVLLDALQRSSYTKVMTSYLYSTNNITHPMHLLYQQQYHDMHSLDSAQPLVYVVDWTALMRDCHVLQRIVNHILHNSNHATTTRQNKNNVYMLLLDASASSQSIMCQESTLLEQLIPNGHQNIRLAKRSIITNRRYNYTKQWIESGTYITNPIATSIHSEKGHTYAYRHILHWSGYVSQSFVQLLDIAIHDFKELSEKRDWRRRRRQKRNSKKESHNTHHRPIDVTHYWKAATVSTPHFIKNEYQYYYNRLRLIVRQQINTTHQVILKQSNSHSVDSLHGTLKQKQNEENDKSLSHWVEHVGIDTQVEFLQTDSSSADGGDTYTNDDRDVDEMDESLARSSVHVAVLASSKIVVVTQADEYEDHDTRLFEALASGAMVLCDTMIAAPLGLVHKTNIVFFNSASKLDHYIQYYLDPENDNQRQEIARHGVEYALGRHRSWHVIEALLFGKALTRTDKHPLTDIGPKIRKPSLKNKYPIMISL